MSSKPDSKTKEIIYEYKLTPGVGDNLYGIEIAEAMGLDPETCKIAYQLRKELIDDSYNINDESKSSTIIKKSRYNSAVILKNCLVEGCSKKAVDTHHIVPQCDADRDGNITKLQEATFHHKNRKFNLTGLCKYHHNQVTYNKLIIKAPIMTTSGVKLIVEKNKK